MFVAFDLGVWVGSILKGNTKMAYKIISSQCTACSACEPECPNVATNLSAPFSFPDGDACSMDVYTRIPNMDVFYQTNTPATTEPGC